jgi:hypothetical protein
MSEVKEREIDRIVENDKEWRKIIITRQTEISEKIDTILNQRITCENRFTKLETGNEIQAIRQGRKQGAIYGVITSIIVLVLGNIKSIIRVIASAFQ